MTDGHKVHRIATEAANIIAKKSAMEMLSWSEIMVVLESVVTIIVTYVAKIDGPAGHEAAFATEVLDSLTEAAHLRIIQAIASDDLPDIPKPAGKQ